MRDFFKKHSRLFAAFIALAAVAIVLQGAYAFFSGTAKQKNNSFSYIKWGSYRIEFNANGGSGQMLPIIDIHPHDEVELPANTFTKTGYKFTGWARSAGGNVEIENGATVKDLTTNYPSTVTLYAKWSPINYTVSFNSNQPFNGSTKPQGNMSSQTFTYDQAQNLTKNAYTLSGYTFTGWNTNGDGKGKAYSDGQNVKNLTDIDGYDIMLFAQWKANTYTVTYNANGGTGSMNKDTFTFDVAKNLTANKFTKTGYTFGGWSKTANPTATTKVDFKDAQQVKNLSAKNGDNINVYAIWIPNKYTVEFMSNGTGISGSMAKQTFTYDVAQNLTKNAFTRKSYEFTGWNTKADGTGTKYTDAQSVKNLTVVNNGNVQLFAQWKLSAYTVKYDKNFDGATGTVPANQVFNYGTSYQLSPGSNLEYSYDEGGQTVTRKWLGWTVDVPCDTLTQVKALGNKYITADDIRNKKAYNDSILNPGKKEVVTLYAVYSDGQDIVRTAGYYRMTVSGSAGGNASFTHSGTNETSYNQTWNGTKGDYVEAIYWVSRDTELYVAPERDALKGKSGSSYSITAQTTTDKTDIIVTEKVNGSTVN